MMSSRPKLPPINRSMPSIQSPRDKPHSNRRNSISQRAQEDFPERTSHSLKSAKAKWMKAVIKQAHMKNTVKSTEKIATEPPREKASEINSKVIDKQTEDTQGTVIKSGNITDNNREIISIATNNILQGSAFLLRLEKQLASMEDRLRETLKEKVEAPEDEKTTDQSLHCPPRSKRLIPTREIKYTDQTSGQRNKGTRSMPKYKH